MSTPVRISAFVVALVAAFALALGLGRAVGPVDAPEPATHEDMTGVMTGESGGDAHLPGGLMVSQDGYTLTLASTRAEAGRAVPLAFTVTGPDGAPVTDYEVEHEKRLHLVVVRRDGTGFQHVHPEQDADGRWTTAVDLVPGDWRVLADFVPAGGAGLTLGADLAVPGGYRPAAPGPDVRTATVDGYTVTLDGELTAGTDALLTLTVTRDDEPVTDLQPYLGAHGHLVALRDGDLAYLHVHPDEGTTAGPEVRFYAEVPSTGRYHLYLDFRHGDRVRTAELVVTAGGTP